MSKATSIGISSVKAPRAGAALAGDGDVVTVALLDQQGNPYPSDRVTLEATSSDPTILAVDTPSGMSYGEVFLKSGIVSVEIVATFPDGTELSENDSVSLTGVPGSLVGTHSLPVVGP